MKQAFKNNNIIYKSERIDIKDEMIFFVALIFLSDKMWLIIMLAVF
jgi:hypothetical protein